MCWCINHDIKIYPIRLQMPLERYKIGIQIRDAAEQRGKEIYTVAATKNSVGVYDKIKELYQHFYNKNNTQQ